MVGHWQLEVNLFRLGCPLGTGPVVILDPVSVQLEVAMLSLSFAWGTLRLFVAHLGDLLHFVYCVC